MTQYSWESLVAKIDQASSVEELAMIRANFLDEAHGRAFIFSPEPLEELRRINQIHDHMIRCVLLLVEHEAERTGLGPPPVNYDFILFGSGGRKEQTLWSDQDNGLIYDMPTSPDQSEEVKQYFALFGKKVTEVLTAVGYPPCEGEVLCKNERWCRSVQGWIEAIEGWYEDPGWENVRYLLITADMRCVYGKGEMTARLRRVILDYPEAHRSVAERLLENTLRHKILIGIFGQFLKEQYGEGAGGIDIKYGAYIPYINGIRLLAILHGVEHSETLERLDALEKQGLQPSKLVGEWREAFAYIVHLRARSLHRLEDGVWSSSGFVKLDTLSKAELNELKRHLKLGKSLQRYVKQSVERYQE